MTDKEARDDEMILSLGNTGRGDEMTFWLELNGNEVSIYARKVNTGETKIIAKIKDNTAGPLLEFVNGNGLVKSI